MNGIQEVSGSIPLISTKSLEIERFQGFSLFLTILSVRLIFGRNIENQEDRYYEKNQAEHNRDKVNFGFAVIVSAEFAWNTPKTDRYAAKIGVFKADLQNLLQYRADFNKNSLISFRFLFEQAKFNEFCQNS